ncbi:MAG: PEP-CTERM sorting domain-containing protein, partial [Verrucomicrobiaceae bacterium]
STIYRFTSAEVAAALIGAPGSGLSATGHEWLDYSALYAGGASSMLVDANGVLIVSFTEFNSSSSLVGFEVDGNGDYNGNDSLILTSDGRLGEIRFHNGELYVADENFIYRLVPEPSSLLFSVLGLAFFARRKR